MFSTKTTIGVLALAGAMLLSVSVELARGQCVPHETDKVFGSGSNGYFGERVSIDGDRAIVGAYGPGEFTGAAYIFERTPGLPNSSWNQVAAFSGGGEHEWFGRAVAIDGDIAIVGAHEFWCRAVPCQCAGPGYVAVYKRSPGGVWSIANVLLAPDGESCDYFGGAVDVSGDTIVVGARQDSNELGTRSGSIYIFERNEGGTDNWGLLRKQTAEDGDDFDQFGFSVAIDEDRIVVGAPRDQPGNLQLAGSAYILSRDQGGPDNWGQVTKLIAPPPNGPTQIEKFGESVAIDGDTILVGTGGSSTNLMSGRAYIFGGGGTTTLVGSDSYLQDSFGAWVSISDDLAIVGAVHQDAAYVFDGSSGWEEVARLTASDSPGDNDGFGQGVAIDRTSIIIGAFGDEANGSASGSAYFFELDSDGDGLYDCWETDGLDINGDGLVDLDLPAMGADAMHKDLFVEVDLDIFSLFPRSDQMLVMQAFADAPVENPDNLLGINLHIQVDEEDLFVPSVWQTPPDSTWPPNFDVLKADHFGTPEERQDANANFIMLARRRAFRYCIFGDEIDIEAYGVAERPGNDFLVAYGEFPLSDKDPGQVRERWLASTFMHELGHNLGLHHGGEDSLNGKPNYISVMNALTSKPRSWNTAFWTLDYSRVELRTLDEEHLNETLGIDAPIGSYFDTWMPYGVTVDDGKGGFVREIRYASIDDTPIDWDGDDDAMDTDTQQDLNWLGNDAPFAAVGDPSFPEVMTGHNDWANLQLRIGTGGDFAEDMHNSVPPLAEITEMGVLFEWIEETFPPVPVECGPADLNDDSEVGAFDLALLLGAWGPCPKPCERGDPADTCAADFDGDCEVRAFDLATLLGAWGPCQ